MNGLLFGLTVAVISGLFGFLWYLLSRQATKTDHFDDRLRGVETAMAHLEERFTRLEDQLSGLEVSVGKVLDKLQDLDTRLAVLEGART